MWSKTKRRHHCSKYLAESFGRRLGARNAIIEATRSMKHSLWTYLCPVEKTVPLVRHLISFSKPIDWLRTISIGVQYASHCKTRQKDYQLMSHHVFSSSQSKGLTCSVVKFLKESGTLRVSTWRASLTTILMPRLRRLQVKHLQRN